MNQASTQYAVRFPGMPLATYREVAAHLRSLSGVTVELEWNTASTFQYTDSQIGSMRLTLDEAADSDRLRAILQHYGSWQESDE